jgi:DNA-repair protein XRCC1
MKKRRLDPYHNSGESKHEEQTTKKGQECVWDSSNSIEEPVSSSSKSDHVHIAAVADEENSSSCFGPTSNRNLNRSVDDSRHKVRKKNPSQSNSSRIVASPNASNRPHSSSAEVKKHEDSNSNGSKDPKPKHPRKLFSQLFDGVVFVISGYENPTRGEIRRKALEMGAQYKRDWDSSCTHLV